MKTKKLLIYILAGAGCAGVLFAFSAELGDLLSNFLLSSFGKTTLKVLGGVILIFVLACIYIEYALKGRTHVLKHIVHQKNELALEEEHKEEKKDEKVIGEALKESKKAESKIAKIEKDLHYHFSYSSAVIFIITLIGLLFAGYSDVFYQQGDFVQPIIRGLNGNENDFDIASLSSNSDTTNLVFVLDVSGSIKNADMTLESKWIDSTIDFISKDIEFKNESRIKAKLQQTINTDSTLGIVKLQLCYLLEKVRRGLNETQRSYKVSFFAFGANTDVDTGFGLRATPFERLINAIIDLQCFKSQRLETNYEQLVKKINYFINPPSHKDGFNRPKTVITIFSDFVNDCHTQDTGQLVKLVAGLCNKSTFFNLVYLEPRQTSINPPKAKDNFRPDSLSLVNKFKLLPLFNEYLYPDYLNIQKITDTAIDLQCATFKSPICIPFLIKQPFIVDPKPSVVKLRLASNEGLVWLTILKRDKLDKKDEWQQFQLQDSLMAHETKYSIADNTLLAFRGHVPDVFSSTRAQFEFPAAKEKITAEIIFQKGLTPFVARLFFTICFLATLISFVYFMHLIFFFLPESKQDKVKKSFEKLFFRRKITRSKAGDPNKNTSQNKTAPPVELVPTKVMTDIPTAGVPSEEFFLQWDEEKKVHMLSCNMNGVLHDVIIGNTNTFSLDMANEWDYEEYKKIDFVVPGLAEFKVSILGSASVDVQFEVIDGENLFSLDHRLLSKFGFSENISEGRLKRL